jgi:hypothetical protein
MKTRALLVTVLGTTLLTWSSGSRLPAFPSNLRVSALSESQQLEGDHRLQEEGQVKEFKGEIFQESETLVRCNRPPESR